MLVHSIWEPATLLCIWIFSYSFLTILLKILIKRLDTDKVAVIDTIPPKVLVDFLTRLLTDAINQRIEKNICPDFAKIASLVSLDRGKKTNNTGISSL